MIRLSTSQSRLVRNVCLLKVCLKPNKQTVRSTRTSFLTFSSTALTRKFRSLANNAEITAEDIYEVLVGACADGTSVSTLCASSQNSPAGNTVLYHLRTKFEPERLERVANTPCERISMNCSPNRWRSAQTSTCGPTTVTKTTQTASITR